MMYICSINKNMKYFIKYSETQDGIEYIKSIKSRIVKKNDCTPAVVDCPRCNGKGGLKHYAHINNGVCYKCDGYRKVTVFFTEQQNENNKALKNLIEKLENEYVITNDFVSEFISKHNDIDFYKKIDSFVSEKCKEEGISFVNINKYSAMYKINCVLLYN